MRSLYWLTAITLVAAAVTTVAIADYGRRHPKSFAGVLMNSRLDKAPAVPVSQSKQVSVNPTETAPSSLPPPAPISFEISSTTPPSDAAPAPFPTESARTTFGKKLRTSSPGWVDPPVNPHPSDLPAPPSVPIDVATVPEHQKLREEALRNLESMQAASRVPPLPATTKKSMEEVDEFTFQQKPIAPLYVPIAPETKVIVPPAAVVKEVAKLPRIPGVSAGNQIATPRPETLEVVRGPEIMPGLHAAKPVEDFNPVQDTLLTLGELFSALNPATYLLSMPIEKKPAKPSAFASIDVPPPTTPVELVVEDKQLSTETSACSKSGNCCKNAGSCSDEVAVRTYSVAEFTNSAGTNHEELIRLITTMVAPDAWNSKDATIEYFALGKCLVVRHRSSVQDQVEDLLTQLRSQVQRQGKSPVVSRERTSVVPVNLEMVPVTPREDCDKMPRVITVEPNRCMEDELLGLMPITSDGRLKPIPMTLPRFESSALVPTQYEVNPVETGWFEDGPVMKSTKRGMPDFFPLHLPYAPLPNGPESCEEQLLNRVGYVNYTDEEVDRIMMLAFECEESR